MALNLQNEEDLPSTFTQDSGDDEQHDIHQIVATTSQGSLSVHGQKLYYCTWGKGTEILVAMPGFLGIGEMDFVRLIKSVPSGVLLVTFHVRGCGQSKPPDRAFPLDFYQQDADDCACMMEQLGFKQYSVLGWCLGGISATVLAADHPQNVKNLILLSSRALLTKQDLDRLETLKDVTTFKPKILRDLILAYGDVEMAQSTWSSFINTFFEIFNRGGDMCQSKLSKIQCPTAILQGVGDVLVPSFHAQYLHDHIHQSHLYMISDGLHALLQQFPAKIQKLIEALLIEGVFVPWDKL